MSEIAQLQPASDPAVGLFHDQFSLSPSRKRQIDVNECSMNELDSIDAHDTIKSGTKFNEPDSIVESGRIYRNSQPSSMKNMPLALADSATGPAKRRKIASHEKEEKRLEREAKEQERAELRAKKEEEKKMREEERKKKEEEKKMREEERRKKAEEREEERKKKEEEREEKRKEKEAERQMVEEERRRKERAQPKLHAFFAKPAENASTLLNEEGNSANFNIANCRLESGVDNLIEGRNSTDERYHSNEKRDRSSNRSNSGDWQHQSDYEAFFLPFTLPSHTTCAPYNRFSHGEDVSLFSADYLEPVSLACRAANGHEYNTKGDVNATQVMRTLIRTKDTRDTEGQSQMVGMQKRGYFVPRIREVMTMPTRTVTMTTMARTSQTSEPFNLTSVDKSTPNLTEILRAIPVKYLHFAEDVRPPYFGTFTRVQSPKTARQLPRDPLARQLPETNYEYDSEAEWEEPEEGEDLASDDGDEEEEGEEEDGGDDMAAFLDDEGVEGGGGKRRVQMGGADLEPQCSGLWWEDENGKLVAGDVGGNRTVGFSAFEAGYLIDRPSRTIDPFSTSYWPISALASTTTSARLTSSQPPSLLFPPSSLSSSSSSSLPAPLSSISAVKTKTPPSSLIATSTPSLPNSGALLNNSGKVNTAVAIQNSRYKTKTRPLCTIANGGLVTMSIGNERTKGQQVVEETVQIQAGQAGQAGQVGQKPTKRFIAQEELPLFSAAVEGSCLTKIALVEDLKRKFPKIPKDAISNTVGAIAVRTGAKEIDKRWVLLRQP